MQGQNISNSQTARDAGLNGSGPIELTTARWCNRPAPAGDNPGKHAKVLAHGGPYDQFAYGTHTDYRPGNGFGYHPDRGDGPLQKAVICSPWSGLQGTDVDNPAAFEVSQAGKLLSRDDAWCTRGGGFHIPLDVRGVDPALIPKQGPAGWGDIKWKGFLPMPGSLHYTGQPYAPTGKPVCTRDDMAEIVTAIAADREAFAAAKAAARAAAREAIAGGSAPAAVAGAARSAARSAYGAEATGTHREMLMELLWECGKAGMTTEQAWAQWQAYSAPWDPARPWTDDHFTNMWKDVPAKVAAMREEKAARLAGLPGRAAVRRPEFEVGNMAIAAETLRGELGRGPLAGLYLRGGTLVHTPRTGEDGYVMPTEDEKARGIDHGPAQVRGVDEGHVRSLVEVRYDVGKVIREKDKDTKKVTEKWVPSLFPHDAARHAVKAAELGIGCPELCHLSGVTHTPVIRRDGTVLDRPGYDRGTGLLFLPTGGLDVPEVPEQPTAEEVKTAAALLREPVKLFPWVAPHHEANWLGAMFTPLLRLMLPPPYQLLIITATNRGSGKTLLLKLLGIVHGMATRGEFPRDKDELRKLFFSTLLTTTAPVIGMDNVRGTIYSGELESLLTAVTLNERELGHSRNVTVTNDRLWVITGNNARIGGDLDRRCLPVALDPRCADPHKRAFKVDPAQWMTANRGRYIAALLTVARGWVLAGAKYGDAGRSDDYRQWYGAMRGLLAFAGIPGTFGAEDSSDLSVMSEDDTEWGTFVAELSRVFEDDRFTTADVIEHLDHAPLIAATKPALTGKAAWIDSDRPHVEDGIRIAASTLPGELAEKWEQTRYGKTSGFARSLGKWLSYRDGRFTADGLTVRMQPGRRARFVVEVTG